MTLKEPLYFFPGIDIHGAIALQMSIEKRKDSITLQKEKMSRGEKEIKAILDELDQIYDDLDRHIAAIVREQEFKELAKKGMTP